MKADEPQHLTRKPTGELDRTLVRPRPAAPAVPEEPVAAPLPEQRSPMLERERDLEPRMARHGCLSVFLWLATFLIAGLCAIRLLPSELASGRLIPEVVSIVPWAILPAAIIVFLALLWRRFILAPFASLCLAALVAWHVGFFVPSGSLSSTAHAARARDAAVSTDDSVMRIMTLNVLNGHADASEVVACVREHHVELLALQEVSWSFLDELASAGIYDVLPYAAYSEAGEWDNGGLNCLFSLAPLYDVDENLLPTELSALCAGTVEINGRYLRFVSCHPSSPHLGGEDLWSEGLATIGSLSEYDHSYVIMGDFNSTWDHARFRDLLGTSFVDASQQAGRGFHMTWPSDLSLVFGERVPAVLAWLAPAFIEIDHIVYAADANIYVGDLETVYIAGTDHLALIGTLEVSY